MKKLIALFFIASLFSCAKDITQKQEQKPKFKLLRIKSNNIDKTSDYSPVAPIK